jgi:hypothetical protein
MMLLLQRGLESPGIDFNRTSTGLWLLEWQIEVCGATPQTARGTRALP